MHSWSILGASLDAHPLELVADKIQRTGAISTLDAAARIGRRVTVAGVQQTSHRSRTAKGDMMLFLTLEDLQGTLDAILFPEVYRQSKSLISSTTPFLLTGIMEMDAERGEPFLRVEKVLKNRIKTRHGTKKQNHQAGNCSINLFTPRVMVTR